MTTAAFYENQSFKVLNDSNHPLKRSLVAYQECNDTAKFEQDNQLAVG